MRLSWGLRGGLAAPPPRHLGGDGAGVREGGSEREHVRRAQGGAEGVTVGQDQGLEVGGS